MIEVLNALEETALDNFNGGRGTVYAKIKYFEKNKVLIIRIPPGSSIGMHKHNGSQETIFVLSGSGKITCDGTEEQVSEGCVHICHNGSSHSIENNDSRDLILFGSVVQL